MNSRLGKIVVYLHKQKLNKDNSREKSDEKSTKLPVVIEIKRVGSSRDTSTALLPTE